MKLHVVPVTLALLAGVAVSWPQAQQGKRTDAQQTSVEARLIATAHPPTPKDLSRMWLAPERAAARTTGATIGAPGGLPAVARMVAAGEYTKALAAASQPSLQRGALGQYALFYAGVSQLALDRAADALKSFRAVSQQKPVGYLAEGALLGEADAQVALGRPLEAVAIYERMLQDKPSSIEEVLLRLGRAAKAAGEREKAADAFARVYYEFALAESAVAAGSELAVLGIKGATAGSPRYELELGRAERLFGARQYTPAREAFAALKPLAPADDRELIQLRLAESDYYLKRFRAARDAVKPLAEAHPARQAEALYFYAVASRDAGDPVTFLRVADRILTEFPTDSWAELILDGLGTYYIRRDDDEKADAAFRRLADTFPKGANAERAAWKAGWRAYRQDKFEDTVHFFERAAAEFPRSDYRPSWLYWAARAHQELGHVAVANERFALVVADYLNSYYGRLAAARLGGNTAATKVTSPAPAAVVDEGAEGPQVSPLPANGAVIRALLDASMYDDALKELRYARRVWGDSPAIQATVAWTNQQQAMSEKGMTRFQLMRGGLNTMRRAYPQFMTAGGEMLPREVLTVIYPVAYWDLLQKYATLNNLDPFLVAALTLQESTFVADIRSHANAYGLMQLMPSTARQYARKLKMPYSSRLLTDPESNIKMGTAYFADKIKEFGSPHLALASYNAGERPVRQWMAERPGLDRDEFIDDIPYPETQGYVRKILGMAEDYRRLYAGTLTPTIPVKPAAVAPKPTPKLSAPPAKPPAPKPVIKAAPAPRKKSTSR